MKAASAVSWMIVGAVETVDATEYNRRDSNDSIATVRDPCLAGPHAGRWRGLLTNGPQGGPAKLGEDLSIIASCLEVKPTMTIVPNLPDVVNYSELMRAQHSAAANASATSGGSGGSARFHRDCTARCI